MERDTLRAAQEAVTADLEQADDHAHTSGRIKAEMDRLKRMTEAERIDLMVARSREFAGLHRDTALFFAALLRWFQGNPTASAFTTRGGTAYTPAHARSEYALARHKHRRVCAQLGHWLAQQAQHQRAGIVIPAAANDANPSSRESAA